MRLHLVTPDVELIDLAIYDPDGLARALDCEIVEGWFVFSGALLHSREALDVDPGWGRWGTRFFLNEDPRELVGLGGFKGAPINGAVEIGYAVSPRREGRGLATAAVADLVDEAFSDSDITTILADTLPDGRSSQRVLEKNGFARDGNGPPHDGTATWRFRLDRPGRRAS